MRLLWKNAVTSGCLALVVTASCAGTTHAEPAANNASAGRAHPAAPATTPVGDRTFVSTTVTAASETTLRVILDERSHGAPLKLSRAERERIAAIVGAPVKGREAARTARPGARQPTGPAGSKKGPATLRCDKNPSWSDGNGTLHARFNCKYGTINWGYKISTRVKSFITGNVNERGVSWWSNGKRKPKNAGHVVGKNYHFHGTLKPVRHADRVQFQDYMTFRVNIGGRTGTGSITWASDVKAKK